MHPPRLRPPLWGTSRGSDLLPGCARASECQYAGRLVGTRPVSEKRHLPAGARRLEFAPPCGRRQDALGTHCGSHAAGHRVERGDLGEVGRSFPDVDLAGHHIRD